MWVRRLETLLKTWRTRQVWLEYKMICCWLVLIVTVCSEIVHSPPSQTCSLTSHTCWSPTCASNHLRIKAADPLPLCLHACSGLSSALTWSCLPSVPDFKFATSSYTNKSHQWLYLLVFWASSHPITDNGLPWCWFSQNLVWNIALDFCRPANFDKMLLILKCNK